MKVYLAAPYAARDALRAYAKELDSVGIGVTSSWLDEQDEISKGTTGAATAVSDVQADAHVRKDFRDIAKADVLVAFTAHSVRFFTEGHTSTSGGRHVETGYALALDKPVIVVGPAENVFHRACPRATDWHAAVLWLVNHERTMPREEASS